MWCGCGQAVTDLSYKRSEADKFDLQSVHHALLRIARHVQHPVQKQRRPVPNQRLAQRSGQAQSLNELEQRNHFALADLTLYVIHV